ncbi:hypothetical protein XI05_01275 [Bradyrhizobium sp. CCBAU 11357]|nr:hypothetical protein [Bradyrhizobium sp. CCBAU 11357]
MLTSDGLDVAIAGSGLTAYNFGGVLGTLMCAMAVTRYRSAVQPFSAPPSRKLQLARGISGGLEVDSSYRIMGRAAA